jgi:hypothetical protein
MQQRRKPRSCSTLSTGKRLESYGVDGLASCKMLDDAVGCSCRGLEDELCGPAAGFSPSAVARFWLSLGWLHSCLNLHGFEQPVSWNSTNNKPHDGMDSQKTVGQSEALST